MGRDFVEELFHVGTKRQTAGSMADVAEYYLKRENILYAFKMAYKPCRS